MASIVLIGLVLSAVGVAAYYAYRHAQVKEDLQREKRLNDSQKKVMKVMAEAIDRGKKTKDMHDKIDAADSYYRLNELYGEIVSMLRSKDPV